MPDYSPGLAGIPAAKSKVSFVDGQASVLEYHGIKIEDFAEQSSFFETTFLLVHNRLATKTKFDQIAADVAHHRRFKCRFHAKHTMNGSTTFGGLVTASTLADPHSVEASAIGALKGPLHGGAASKFVEMLEAIGTWEKVRSYLEKKLAAKERIMGFGHLGENHLFRPRQIYTGIHEQSSIPLAQRSS